MGKKNQLKAGKTQIIWEGILKWSAFTVMCMQLTIGILWFPFRDLGKLLTKVEKWAAIVPAGLAIAYVVYTYFKTPRLMFRIKNFLKGLFCPEFIMLLLFFVWNVICTMSADSRYSRNMFSANDNALFRTFVSVFITFIIGYIFRGDSVMKLMEILFHVFCSVLTVCMIYILYMMCKPEWIHLPGGRTIYMRKTFRLCISCNSNTTGAISEVIFMMCLYMMIVKKGILRYLYTIAMLVHYLIVVLSNSRTCIYATGISIAAIVGKLCFDAVKNRVFWQKILVSVILSVVTAIVIIELRRLVFYIYESISHLSKYYGVSKTGARETEMTFSGRVDIWIASVKSVFQNATHFFFGVTPVRVTDEVSIWTTNHLDMYTHNEFLEISVAYGVPGLLLYLTWLVMIARSCFRVVNGKIRNMNKGLIILSGMILMLVLANLMEATLLFYQFTIIEGMFFLACGIITYRLQSDSLLR